MARHDITEQHYDVSGARVAIVAARFNAALVERLVGAAGETLERHQVRYELVRVPGAFELPFAARRLAASGRFEAVIALGAVVRGGTPHFEYVCEQSAAGLMRSGLDADLPVLFGVLTCDDMIQAEARTGGAEGNKGHETALAALEMIAFARAWNTGGAS